MASKKLPMVLNNITSTSYQKPEKKNKLVSNNDYNKIDNAIVAGAKIGTNGVIYVEESEISHLLAENKSDGQYIIEELINEEDKRNIGGIDVIDSSALVGLLHKRSQEVRSSSKQAKQQYSRDSLINVADSPEAQAIRRELDDFTNKEQKKLRNSRVSEVDEITGKPLEKGYAFHHKNQKSLYTDPEKAIDPNEGVLVNNSTHKEIHKLKIRDAKSLEEYKKEIENNQ